MTPDITNGEPVIPEPLRNACEEFSGELQSSAGPSIEDYLQRVEPELRIVLFRELLSLEMQHLSVSGTPNSAESYRQRFPEYTATIEEIFQTDRHAHSIESTQDWIDSDTDDGTPSAAKSNDSSMPTEIGRFQITKILGRGAFGTVYLAHDPQLQRTVALKIPRAGILHEPRDRQRFLSEATTTAQLHHPHIVPVYESGTIDQTCYIASEFIEGTTLREKVAGGWKPTHRDISQLLVNLASALHYAHNKGVIHRDIKPDNIMIDDAGVPHIMDFGLARWDRPDQTMTLAGTRMGTPSYMSPEQAKGESHLADARSDLWALGVILYELLTKKKPFRSRSHKLLQEIIEEEPDSPKKISPAISLDLETICLKCLAKESDQRYPSCQHLSDELQRWMRLEPIEARPIGTLERFSRWRRRKPLVAALSAISAFLAIVLLLAGPTMYIREASLRHRAQQAEGTANRKAEQAQKALAAKSMQAARLASQRGQWRQSLRHLQAAEQTGYADDIVVRLEKIRAYRSIIDMEKWTQEVETLAKLENPGSHRAEVLLLQAERLRYFQKYEESDELIKRALALDLPPAQAEYARAHLTDTVTKALIHLRESVRLDPYDHQTVTVLVATLFFSGLQEETHQQSLLAHHFFPDDPNFPLVLAMLAAMDSDKATALGWVKLVEQQYSPEHAAAARIYIDSIDTFSSVVSDPNNTSNKLKMITTVYSAIKASKKIQRSVHKDTSSNKKNRSLQSSGSITLSLLPAIREAYRPVADLFPSIFVSVLAGNYSRQIDALGRSVEKHPEGTILWLRANLLARSKRYAEAEKDFESAIDAPSMFPPINYLSALNAAEVAIAQYESDGNKEHLARVTQYIHRIKDDSRLNAQQKIVAFQAAAVGGDFELALVLAKEALEKKPDDFTWLQYRVMAELGNGAYANAVKTADRLLKKHPDDAQTLRYKQSAIRHLKEFTNMLSLKDSEKKKVNEEEKKESSK